jgi:hypothetical protein
VKPSTVAVRYEMTMKIIIELGAQAKDEEFIPLTR